MQEMLAPSSYIKGTPNWPKSVALITTGVSAAAPPPPASARHPKRPAAATSASGNGDVIEIDIPGRTLNAKSARPNWRRPQAWKDPPPLQNRLPGQVPPPWPPAPQPAPSEWIDAILNDWGGGRLARLLLAPACLRSRSVMSRGYFFSDSD